MKKVLFSGYYGFSNTGDEAILETVSTEFKNRGFLVSALSNSPEKTSKAFGIKAYHRFQITQIFKGVKDCDVLISGGGSLFQDITGFFSIYYYSFIIILGMLMGKDVYIYSQGIGPIKRKINRFLFKVLAKKVKGISVRDQKSYDELINMGINENAITLTADPVFMLEPSGLDKASEILFKNGIDLKNKEFKLISVAVRKWDYEDIGKWVTSFAQICDNICEEFNAKILFIPFHMPHDYEFSKEIIGQMNQKAYIIENEHKPSEVLSVMARMDLNIAVRLHALIFSAKVGVPLIGISYDPKIDGFLKSLNDEPLCGFENITYEKFRAKINQIFNNKNIVENLNKKMGESCLLAQKTLENLTGDIEK